MCHHPYKILPCGGLEEGAAPMLPLALDSPESVTAMMEQDGIFMGLKKPVTSTLKAVSCMYWTQTAQQVVEYIPTYPIYNHSSFCMPKKAFPP